MDFWVKTNWNANDGITHTFIDNRPASYADTEYKNALKIAKYSSGQDNYFYFKILDKDGRQIEANTYSNKTLTSEWTKDKWHHIAAVWNLLEGKVQLFIDGNKVAEKNTPISLYNPDSTLYIGADKDGNQPSSSTIDELRFSSKAKTEEELKSYHNQGYVILKEFDAGKNVVWKSFNWLDEAPLDFGIAYWNFDDAESAIANEPNNNKGTLIGADTPSGVTLPKWTRDAVHGNALTFSGEKSYVEAPINTSFNLTDFSIEAWVKTSDKRYQSVLSTFSLSDANNPLAFNPFYQLEVLESGKASLFISNKIKDQRVESMTDIADGKWHQIIGVRDTKQKKIVIYVDGKIENTIEDTTSGNIYPVTPVLIGNQKDRSGRNFKGNIDEVRILNRTLSPTEVLLSYERKFWRTHAQLRFKKEGSDWGAFGGVNPTPHYKNIKGQLALLTFEDSDTFWQNLAIDFQKPSMAEGRYSQGAKFEAQQFLAYPSNVLNLSEGTIDFWIKLNRDSLQQTQTILESGNDKNSLKIYLSGSDKKIKISIKDKNNELYELSTDVSSWKSNEWHHAAFAWKADDGSDRNRMLLFLEGKLVAENPSKTNKLVFDGQSTTVAIGNSNAKNSPALATLDDLQITNIFRATDLYESGYSNPSGEKLNFESRYVQAKILLTTADSSFTPAISSINFFTNETIPTTQLSATPTPTVTQSQTPISLQLITVSKPNITFPLSNSQVSGDSVTIKWTAIANASKYTLVVRDRDDSSLRCGDCGNNCLNNPYFVCIGNLSNSTTSLNIPVIEEHHYTTYIEVLSPSGISNLSDYSSFTVNKSKTSVTTTPTPTKTPTPTMTPVPIPTLPPILTQTPAPVKTPQQEIPAPVSPVTSVKTGPSTTVVVVLVLLLVAAIVGGFFAFKFIAGKNEEEIGEVRKEKLSELKSPLRESSEEEPRKSEAIKQLEDFEPVEGGIKLRTVKPEVPQELKDYVDNFLKRGFTKEQIKKTLKQVGWNEDVIEEVLE
ncbi:MAG: LamG domain-containing protein [Nanoarchaeota archaeon]